jgi:predicted SprT family Zn-dependent metalloprotease
MPSNEYSLDGESGLRALDRFARYPVPDWATRLVEEIVDEYLPSHFDELPTIVFVPVRSRTKFGGRHYPEANAIAVYDSYDRELTRSVVIHEMAHWIRRRTGDPRGKHDGDFYDLLGELYRRYGIRSALARDVEPFCEECEYDWRW